jgi:hypothetical protein
MLFSLYRVSVEEKFHLFTGIKNGNKEILNRIELKIGTEDPSAQILEGCLTVRYILKTTMLLMCCRVWARLARLSALGQ